MKSFVLGSIILLILLLVACPNNDTADCDPGYHPCENNPSECCLDTTSHYVDWVIDTLGVQGGDNWLMDAAIIDEDNIWVVGEIHTDSLSYSAAVWDGEKWNLIRLMGQYSFLRPHGIWINSKDDIWFAVGSIFHYDGDSVTLEWERDWVNSDESVENVWGNAQTNELFFIGSEGTIVHFDGTTFERMDSGTDVDLRSINGTNPNNVWVSGYNDSDLHTVLLHYDGYDWRTAYEGYSTSEHNPNHLSGAIRGVFTDDPDSVWVIAYLGLYRCPKNTQGEGILLTQHPEWHYAMKTISGNNHNDLIFAGAFSAIWHYNGNDLKFYDELIGNRVIYGSDTKQNVTVLVGYSINTSQAFVIRGYR